MEAMTVTPTLTDTSVQAKVARAAHGLSDADKAKLKKSCEDFEGVLVGMMLREMEKTVHEGKLFSGGKGEEIFKDLKITATAEEIAKSGTFGLSDVLYTQLAEKTPKAVTAKNASSAYANRR
jgi:flagellar protein FlgJ